jgi:arylsulfatase
VVLRRKTSLGYTASLVEVMEHLVRAMGIPTRSGCSTLIALLLLAIHPACTASRPGEGRTSVILVTIDALRADSLSFAGGPHIESPNLDRFAAKSVVFTEAISSFVGTTAAMPSLMTGLFPSFEGVDRWNAATYYGFSDLNDPDEKKGLTRNVRTLPEILESAGYATAGFNTNPLLTSKFNFDQGFAHYEEFGDFYAVAAESREHRLEAHYPPANVVVDRVLRWLDTAKGLPFFVWFHLMDPHSPYLPPPPFHRLPERSYTVASDLEINEALYRRLLDQDGKHPPQEYISFSRLPGSRKEVFAHVRALYEGEIAFADRELGRLFEELEKRRLLESTLVVVTADHGEEFLEHGHVSHHRLEPALEELIRIPLVVRLPASQGTHQPARIDPLVTMVDLAPTVLDYVGLADEASAMNGSSLRPLIEGSEAGERTAFISSINYGVARTKEWKYRRIKRPFGEHLPGESLFRIAHDPLEQRDVAPQHPERLLALRAHYDAFAQELRQRGRPLPASSEEDLELDPETAERLRGLGYLGE